MARQFTVEIGDHEYEGTTASAKNQFEALHIAMRTGLVASFRDDAQDMSKVAVLGGLAFDDVKKLESLLVADKVERDKVPVASNLFGDDIQDYYLLIYEVIKENLGGFWKLRRPTDSKKPAEQNP